MILSDLDSYIKAQKALHKINYDGSLELNGPKLDRLPSPEQTFESAVFILRLEDGAADEDVDIRIEESNDNGNSWSTLKDVGKVTYDQLAGGTTKTIALDLDEAARHLRFTVLAEGSSGTNVGNADLTVTVDVVFGGAHKLPA